ncbi:uncharacterized protein N7511_001460 [Penicillium nucicola]|uniref:uncharacterized protein n=1 Tax=Penicillium nucicola TaxID=1850975 RepID=UPI002544F163|nr:uncharacterized protein N7511_001460 [Penicillium nucicola]KAJ5776449.1 hypothetical protein N7511_001460 [Penicillium nucicola]
MADPLSPVASVIAIATAASQICKAISRLRAFGQVPYRVYVLRNEVTDLEVVLRQVAQAIEQNSSTPGLKETSLKPILARTKDILLKLATSLEHVSKACNGGKFINRANIFLKETELFQGFQDDIRTMKSNLTLILGTSNS